jgi:hypothetical protein
MRHNKLFRRLLGLICSSAILVLAGVFVSAVSSAAAPPGNNGTVDLSNQTGTVGEQPKVSCPFDIVFSDFDPNQYVTAELVAQNPSGSGVVFTASTTLDSSGAGTIPVTALDLTDLTVTSNGVHLQLDVVDLPKHKTFWASDCAVAPTEGTTTTTTSTTTTSTTVKTTDTVPSVVTTVPPQVLGQTIVSSDGQPAVAQSGSAPQAAAPASAHAAAPASAPAKVAGVTALAHTGPNTRNLLIISTWLFALGGALVTFSKLGRVPEGS